MVEELPPHVDLDRIDHLSVPPPGRSRARSVVPPGAPCARGIVLLLYRRISMTTARVSTPETVPSIMRGCSPAGHVTARSPTSGIASARYSGLRRIVISPLYSGEG